MFPYETDILSRSVGDAKRTRNHIGMERWNIFFEIMVKRSKTKRQQEKAEKLQNVIVAENNLSKDFTTEKVRNYDQN